MLDPDLVQTVLDIGSILKGMEPSIAEVFVHDIVSSRLYDIQGQLANLDSCQSPIEQLFMIALWNNSSGIRCFPQPEITCNGKNYRPDFCLRGHGKQIFVECDGHDFHEKTKEQARRDKARDRDFLQDGHTIVHFTGSEIWKDAASCVTEAIAMLEKGETYNPWSR